MPADEARRAGDEVVQESSLGGVRGSLILTGTPRARNTSRRELVETGWRPAVTGLRRGPCPARSGGVNPSTPPLLSRRQNAGRGRDPLPEGSRRARRRLARHAAAAGRASGVIPEVDGTGDWTTAAVAHARIVARLRERGHRLEEIQEAGQGGPARLRLHRGAVRRRRAERALAEGGREAHRARAGADRALLDEPRPARPGARAAQRRGHPGAALRRRRCSAPASRWWPSSSSAASTARRSPRSPTPRCACSTSTCTSR